MRFPFALPAALLLATGAVLAADPPARPSARLLAASPPEFLPGRCVIYEEAGEGMGALADYYVRGRVVATRIESRQAGVCPRVPGRGIENYTRAEFNRLALAQPCVLNEGAAGEVRIGLVTLRVEAWETPHNRRAANVGRLYRGMFIDRELKKDIEIEIEADQLGSCES